MKGKKTYASLELGGPRQGDADGTPSSAGNDCSAARPAVFFRRLGLAVSAVALIALGCAVYATVGDPKQRTMTSRTETKSSEMRKVIADFMSKQEKLTKIKENKKVMPDEEEKETKPDEEEKETKPEEEPCRKPKRGDFCHQTVMFTMTQAWRDHPEWSVFQGLPESAQFEDVQLAIHADLPETCPKPCHKEQWIEDQPCRTAGDYGDMKRCYSSVLWTMEVGMEEHPNWFAGLGRNSSFEDVQYYQWRDPESKGGCPKPCDPPECHTVAYDDTRPDYKACMSTVEWIQNDGIPQHPEWFEGLPEGASLWEIQDHVAKDQHAEVYCPLPCEEDFSPTESTSSKDSGENGDSEGSVDNSDGSNPSSNPEFSEFEPAAVAVFQ